MAGRIPRRVMLGLGGLLLVGVVLLGILAGSRLWTASHTPQAFVVYFYEPVTPDAFWSLQRRISALDSVSSVEFLSADTALARFKADVQKDPDILNQPTGPPLRGALQITMRRAGDPGGTKAVARTIEDDPAFVHAVPMPAPPGGWTVPPN